MRVLVVIPTYNEKENLRSLATAIFRELPTDADLLIVDDASPDGTGALADVLAKETGRVHVLHRSGKLGLGSAYVAGMSWGMERGYEGVIQMDADFSHDPKYLPTMRDALASRDLVIGSRYVPGGGTRNWSLGRRLLSRGGSLYSRWILGASIRDFTGGFMGWRREALAQIDLRSMRSDGYSFQIELKYRAYLLGLRIHEFPIVFVDREAGRSKMHRKIVFEALLRVWQFRFGAARRRIPWDGAGK